MCRQDPFGSDCVGNRVIGISIGMAATETEAAAAAEDFAVCCGNREAAETNAAVVGEGHRGRGCGDGDGDGDNGVRKQQRQRQRQ